MILAGDMLEWLSYIEGALEVSIITCMVNYVVMVAHLRAC